MMTTMLDQPLTPPSNNTSETIADSADSESTPETTTPVDASPADVAAVSR